MTACLIVIIFDELLLMYRCLNAALRAAYLRLETSNKSYVGFEGAFWRVRFGISDRRTDIHPCEAECHKITSCIK